MLQHAEAALAQFIVAKGQTPAKPPGLRIRNLVTFHIVCDKAHANPGIRAGQGLSMLRAVRTIQLEVCCWTFWIQLQLMLENLGLTARAPSQLALSRVYHVGYSPHNMKCSCGYH